MLLGEPNNRQIGEIVQPIDPPVEPSIGPRPMADIQLFAQTPERLSPNGER
jgi:hypothetical protein